MSYSTIALCANDEGLYQRITACVAQEQLAKDELVQPQPALFVWAIACASDVEAAYASALAAGNPHPGEDPAVITDGMILAKVQAHWVTP